jgi:hypothetical protein
MRRARHHGDAAKTSHSGHDSLVIGRYHDRTNAARLSGAPIDVLHHRTTGDISQRFAGQPCGVVSSGDDGDYLRGRACAVEGIREPDRVHDES